MALGLAQRLDYGGETRLDAGVQLLRDWVERRALLFVAGAGGAAIASLALARGPCSNSPPRSPVLRSAIFPVDVIVIAGNFPDIRTGQQLRCAIRAPFVLW